MQEQGNLSIQGKSSNKLGSYQRSKVLHLAGYQRVLRLYSVDWEANKNWLMGVKLAP